MKSPRSAQRTLSHPSRRGHSPAVAGLVPLAMALAPLAVMSWVVAKTGAGLA